MAGLSTATKGWLGVKAAKGVAKNPGLVRLTAKAGAKSASPLAKLSWKAGKPLAKRQTRRKVEQIGDTIGSVVAAYGPEAARQLGLVEPPKEKRTTPRVLAGAVIGASAVYFLEPKCGREHRQQVARLVS